MSPFPLPRLPSRRLAVALAALVMASTSQAQTPTNSWDSLSGNWVGGTPAANGSVSTILQFTMNSNPYLSDPAFTSLPLTGFVSSSSPTFTLNGIILNLQSTATGGLSAQTAPSSSTPFNWNLVANGAALPFINVTGFVSNNLGASFGSNLLDPQTFTLSSNTTIGGNGSGLLTFAQYSFITGSGSLTFARTGAGPFAVTVLAPASSPSGTVNTYSGGTIIQSGAVLVDASTTAAGSAFGKGSLTLNGGTLAAAAAFTSFANASINIGGNMMFGYVAPGGQTLFSPFVSSVAVSAITLGNGSGTISLTGTGSPTLTSVGGQTTTLATSVSSVNSGVGLTSDGWGTLVLGTANTYSGNTQLNLGTLQLNNASALGSTGSLVFNGGWVQNPSTTVALTIADPVVVKNNVNVSGAGATPQGIAFSSTTAVDLGQAGGAPVFNILPTSSATTFNAPLVNNESFAVGLFKTGAGALVLTVANLFNGATTISPLPPSNAPFGLPLINANGAYPTGGAGGQITLNAAGALASGNAGVIIVGPGANSTGATTGGTLLLDNTAQNVNNRLGGSSVPLDLQGGAFQIIGNTSSNSSESFGPLTVDAGNSTINLSIASGSTSTSLQATAASLTRSNFGVLSLVGTSLGKSAAGTNGVASLTLTNSATATGALVGGGGAIGTTNISIVPWISGETSAFGSASVNTFVTFNSSYGFHPLTSSEYSSITTLTSGSSTTNNIEYSSGTTSTLTSATTINALNFADSANISGAGPLIITSGAILARTAVSATISSSLVAGSTGTPAELVVFGPGSLVVNGAMTSSGLTIGSTGTITLGGANSNLTGNIALDSGTLTVTAANQFGAASSVVFQGGALKFNQATGDVSVSANFTVGTPGGAISLPKAGATQTLTGNLVGAGALNLTGVNGTDQAAPNAFNFAGDNSGFMGTVVLSTGALNLNSADSGGNNAGNTSAGYGLTLTSGTLLGANGTGPVSVPGTVTLLGSTTAASLLIGGAQNLNLATGTNSAFVLPTPSGATMIAAISVLNPSVTLTIAGLVSTSPAGTSNTTVNGYQTTGLTSFVKQGPGTLVFSQPLTMNGNIGNIGGGVLQFNGLTIGGGVANGFTAVTGTSNGFSLSTGTITFNGTTTFTAGQLLNNFGVVTFTGPATLNAVAGVTNQPGALINNFGQVNFLGPTASFGGDITLNGGQLTFGSATAVSGIGNIGLSSGAVVAFTSGGPSLQTIVTAGAVTIAGTASLGTLGTSAANSQVIVGPEGALTLDNTAVNSNSRFANGAGSTPNTFSLAGQLTILGNATTPTVEAVGTMVQNTSYLGMGTITLVPAGTNETRVVINSLWSTLYAFGSSLLIQGYNLGNATALASGSGLASSRIICNTVPSMSSAVATDGAANIRILPVAFGFDASSGQFGFLTYDTAIVNGVALGLRPLNPASEYASSFTVGASTTNNISVSSAITNVNSSTSVGSLLINGGGGISGAGSLTVTSAAVLAANGANNGITLSALTLTSTALYETGVVTTVSNLTLNGNLTTGATMFGGVIKDGPGILTLNGTVTLATAGSPFYINEGTVALGQNNAIGATNVVQIAPTGFLNLNGTSQSFGNLASSGAISTLGGYTPTGGGGVLLPSGSVLTVGGNNVTNDTFDGFLIGQGAFNKTGTGNDYLTRFSPFTGAVNVNGGTLTLYLGTGVLANASITLNGGTLDLGGVSQPTNSALGASLPPARVQVTYIAYCNLILGNAGGGLATIEAYTTDGVISGTGALTTSGLGSLSLLNTNSSYSGGTSIVQGSLAITSSVLNNQNSPLGNSSSTITLAPNGTDSVTLYLGAANNESFSQNLLIDRPMALGGTSSGSRTITFSGNVVLTANSSGIDLAGNTLSILGEPFSNLTILAPIRSSSGAGQVQFNTIFNYYGNVNFWAASTYSGGTTLAIGAGSGPVQLGLGVDTLGAPGSILSGPLGTGAVTISSSDVGASFHADNPTAPYLSLATTRQFANSISITSTQPQQINLIGVNNLNLLGAISESSAVATTFTVGASNLLQNLTLSGVVTASGSVTKAGPGILTLGNAGNLITGAWTLSGGSLAFASDSALGNQTSGSNLITVSAGGTALNLIGNVTSARNISYTGASAGALTIDAAPSTSSTFSGLLQQGSGAFSIIKNDTGTLTLSGGVGLTGTVTVNNGALNTTSGPSLTGYAAIGPGSVLNVTGTIANGATATLTASLGSQLILNNSANSSYVSFASGAATLSGGALALVGSTGTTNTQSIGTVSLTANTTSTISLTPTNGAGGPLILASSRLTVGSNAVLLVAGANLGGATASSSQVTFTTAPTLVGSGASNAPNRGIVAGVIGDVTPTGTGSGFVTYGGANGTGLVPLSSAEYIASITTGDNVQLSASNSIATGTAVNSLYLQSATAAATLSTGNAALTITSGMLLVNNAAAGSPAWSILGIGASSALATAGATPVLWVVSNLTLSVPLTTTATGAEKGGPGTLILNNTTGATTTIFAPTTAGTIFRIDGGTVQVGQTANVFNTNVVVQVGAGATFDLNGNSQTIGGLSNATAGVTLVNPFTGALLIQPIGSVTLEAAPASAPPTLTVAGATTDTFTGTISGAGGFTRSGSGTTTFYAPQSFTGTTTILSGTLAFGAIGTMPLLASSSIVIGDPNTPTGAATLTLPATGAAYSFGTSSQTLTVSPVDTAFTGTRTLNGNANVYTNPATQLSAPLDTIALNIVLAGTATNPSRLTLTNAAVFTGTISDTAGSGSLSGSIAFNGTTTWYFTGANSYTGGTVILGSASATIGLGASSSLGTGPVAVSVNQNGTPSNTFTSLTLFSLLAAGSSLTISNPINFSGAATSSDLTVTGLSDLVLAGVINLNTNSATSVNRTINITNFGTTTFSGGLTSTGPVPVLTKNGAGLLVLSVDSPTLATSWQISDGIVQILTNNGLGAAGNSVSVNASSELDLNGAAAPGGGITIGTTVAPSSLTIAELGYTGQGALHNISGANTWNGPVTLTGSSNMNSSIGVDAGSSLTINGNVSNGVNIPPVNFTKYGAGALTINGNLTNTGQTFVNGGQMIVNGTVSAGDLMTVQQTAGLGGSATINRTVTFETGTSISPGAPGTTPGAITFNNNLTFLGGFTYNWRVSGSAADVVVVNNAALTFSPLDVVDVRINDLPGTGPTQNVYTLFDPASSITGFNGANWIVDTSGLSNANAALWSAYTVNQVGNTIVLSSTATPEPTAPLLVIAMAAGVVWLFRRGAMRTRCICC
jgi:fibronectin-binding autotransporter adhesin